MTALKLALLAFSLIQQTQTCDQRAAVAYELALVHGHEYPDAAWENVIADCESRNFSEAK